MRNDVLIGALVVTVAIVAGLFFFLREPDAESTISESTDVVPVPVALPEIGSGEASSTDGSMELPVTAPTPQPIVLPPLNDSDTLVRDSLAAAALPESWLAREDLVRRVAVVMDNARKGDYPRQQLSFLAPVGKFEVIDNEAGVLINPVSYERFDRYLDVLESVEPKALAGWLKMFEPLIAQALSELDNQGDVASQTRAAIDLLMAVPELDGDVAVVQPKVFYEYADPRIEALKPLQKQALRMGPGNVRRLKSYLTRLSTELEG